MISKIDLLGGFHAALEKELSLVQNELEKADKNKELDKIRIILSYAKGLERSFEIGKLLIQNC